MEKRAQKIERYAHVDLLESIAIFFVVLYHCCFYNFNFIEQSKLINYCFYFFRSILSSCVPLFFFVNGFLLLNKPFVLKNHVRKMLKIVLITIIWSFFLVLLTFLIRQQDFSLKLLILLVLDMESTWTNILWFLCALFCIYIFFPLLKVTYDNHRKAFFCFTVIVFLFTLGLSFCNEVIALLSTWFHIDSVNGAKFVLFESFNPFKGMYGFSLFYFCAGGLFYGLQNRILSVNRNHRNALAVLCLLVSMTLLFFIGLFFSFNDNSVWDIVWNGYDTIFTFGIVISLFVLSLNYSKRNTIIELISMNTLGVYLIHILFVRLIGQLSYSNGVFSEFPMDVVIATLVFILSFVFVIILKKVPIIKNIF